MLRPLIIFFILLTSFHGPAMADEGLLQILDGIKEKYGSLAGLSIPYTREVITRSMSMLGEQARGDRASGKIYFKHPCLLRLEQEKPKPETIIANQDTLSWYIPSKKCAYQYPSKDFGKELQLLSDVFHGLSQVEDNFQVVLQGRNDSGEYEIQLAPEPPWQEIDQITLSVTDAYEIRAIRIHNQLGGITIFRLGTLTEKSNFSEKFFHFVAPEGVKVVVEGTLQ